jgi:two-component system OmpR family sensor kinase
VDATQTTLVTVLVIGSIISMTLAGLAGWLSTRRALAPLEAVTNTALQITRADDLSRRILYQGPANDEVGQLIHAFNQTLSRLENLFDTQRRFIADVGHELRTPLTVIKGNVDLMRRMGYSDDESLEGIENEVDRLTRLVGDLLLLAQAESGKLPLDRRLVELDTLVLEAMQQMRVLARDRLNLHLGDIDQVLVCGDRDRLKQVLVNLIGNAIKYTPKGGEVVVGLGKVNNQAQLTVRDTGPGIPEEDLPYIFERFYRGEKSRTRSRDGKGFGLGLSIAYWIVRNHDGRIEVNSKLEQGTTFCVWLPLAPEDCPPQ